MGELFWLPSCWDLKTGHSFSFCCSTSLLQSGRLILYKFSLAVDIKLLEGSGNEGVASDQVLEVRPQLSFLQLSRTGCRLLWVHQDPSHFSSDFPIWPGLQQVCRFTGRCSHCSVYPRHASQQTYCFAPTLSVPRNSIVYSPDIKPTLFPLILLKLPLTQVPRLAPSKS